MPGPSNAADSGSSQTAAVEFRVIEGKAARNDTSRQVRPEDTFQDAVIAEKVLQTPYPMDVLATIREQSNILPQCIEAMVTNIAKYGFRIAPIAEGATIDSDEEELLKSFCASANTEESLSTVHSSTVDDYEHYGFGFYEVIRNQKGEVSLIKNLPSFNTRLTKKDETLVTVRKDVYRGGKRSTVIERRRFRKYVQVIGTTKVYFKEMGDPRDMDYRTGEYARQGRIAAKNRATEVMHRRQRSEDGYGVPRWIAQLPSIFGSREAEEVNLRYFEDNTVPPMMISVAGGRLTRESYEKLNKLLAAKGVGKDRQNQIILVEAIPESSGLEEKGSISLKVDKLTDARQSDGLFSDYDDANIAKIRSSFRLPPVAVGMSENTTFASAQVSAYISETQVYLPERMGHDEFLNKNLVNHPNGLNLKTCKLESKGPTVTNPDQIVRTLTAVNVMGGVTPRSSIDMVNETLQLSLPQYPEPNTEGWEEWMDMPMPLSQKVMGATQQTGEGDDPDMQGSKDTDIKDREKDGETGVGEEAVEHGKENG